MNTETISPAEAWEEVGRRKININHTTIPCEFGQWYATVTGHKWHLGWGNEPLEAVVNLLGRIAEADRKAETANV
jgi:hypothetical protein